MWEHPLNTPNALLWLSMIYPVACNPRFIGLLSFTTSPAVPGGAILGIIIRWPYIFGAIILIIELKIDKKQ